MRAPPVSSPAKEGRNKNKEYPSLNIETFKYKTQTEIRPRDAKGIADT
jgi:hypothetical protein